jgi:hypothetical protein
MSGSHGSHAGAAAGPSGFDDDGCDSGLNWTQHPTYVNSLLQQEHSGFDNTNSPALLGPTSLQCAADHQVMYPNFWSSPETHDLPCASSDPTPGPPPNPESFASLSTAIDPRLGGLGNTAVWGAASSDDHNYHHPPALFMPSLPLAPHPKLPKEGWTQAQQEMLIRGRQAGRGFVDIAEDMRLQFGVEITPNALVKRFGKIQETHLGVSMGHFHTFWHLLTKIRHMHDRGFQLPFSVLHPLSPFSWPLSTPKGWHQTCSLSRTMKTDPGPRPLTAPLNSHKQRQARYHGLHQGRARQAWIRRASAGG